MPPDLFVVYLRRSADLGRQLGKNLMRNDDEKSVNINRGPKKPYRKPSFRHERIFETMALTCGKMTTTQKQCQTNLKTS